LYLKFWMKLTALVRYCRFSLYFRSYSASAARPVWKLSGKKL